MKSEATYRTDENGTAPVEGVGSAFLLPISSPGGIYKLHKAVETLCPLPYHVSLMEELGSVDFELSEK